MSKAKNLLQSYNYDEIYPNFYKVNLYESNSY